MYVLLCFASLKPKKMVTFTLEMLLKPVRNIS